MSQEIIDKIKGRVGGFADAWEVEKLILMIEQQKQDYEDLLALRRLQEQHCAELRSSIYALQEELDARRAATEENRVLKRMFEMAYHGHCGMSLTRDNWETTYKTFHDKAAEELRDLDHGKVR